ncbi:xanthine dehydrogenase molybdopterin binding subunit [Silicimonas algicola]|uniref:Xanthine dehydrogenase molybdenum binding subunit apoprotein n=1 Tax=Silicimonas algicola TaxID=1826607 RepID=A0A316G639_9RHOB|nr:xanthine dehydrogenase molybdopterin binding subunit [Silicimonas algicola]AZQ69346.1 xanthine dehydrogenase molybdopterin binding subunit [Silicimonas algicola]PWK56409.1 xanthine dehydrogenase molybdenum binding subunit apoprotein [Silicimonas algicola]
MSVAKPLPHDAAPLHVTGQARYVDDIPLPKGALHLAFGMSEEAHGRLLALDLEAVKTAPGVVAVLAAGDLPFANDVSPSPSPEPLLATDTVEYIGQPLFLVIAESHLAARRAARLGLAEIAPLPAILTIDDAIAADSRFEDGPRLYQKGDAARAIAEAERRLEGSLEIGGQEHFYLEGQAAVALPQEGGDMVVHSSTQHPTEIQHKVAEAIGRHMNSVRVEVRRMGGGFGGKESQGNALAVSCAIGARLTGLPCSMRYDRDDDMTITGKRHDFRIDYRVGFDGKGRIAGVEFVQFCRCGWSMDLSLPVADRAMLHADNAYDIPHMRVESHRLKTNTQSATAFRGFGGPQGMLGIERVLDHVAHSVGRDPAEVRTLNFYRDVAVRSAGSGKRFGGAHSPIRAEFETQTTHYGMPVEDFILNGMVERLRETSDYSSRKAAISKWNASNALLKKGISLTPVKFGISFTLTHLNQAGALVHVYQDSSIHLNHGGTEMGQGLFQKVAQVAASRFGVGPERVKITATDTGKVPNTSATAASSGSDLNGMAVQVACDAIRDRLAVFVAERAQADPGSVRFEDNEVHVGSERIPFEKVVLDAYQARVSLSSTGFYATPKVQWDRIKGQGRPFFYFAYGAAVSEVVIDTLTGEYRILRTDILHDCGTSLNPAIDIGQIEGGYVQGAGWLTTEELVWDDKGRLRTHAPSTYKIPACSDRPEVFNAALWDGANREETVYRSKAVGEPPLMLGISAFLALSDAVASCGSGYPALRAPATPEAVLAAVRRVQA